MTERRQVFFCFSFDDMNILPEKQLNSLNDLYGNAKRIYFELANGKYPLVNICNDAASAAISLYGAQVLSYAPREKFPVIWLSQATEFEDGQPLRGGIPVCWPWFGAHPDNEQMPSHGFLRLLSWQLKSIVEINGKTTEVKFTLTEKAVPRVFSSPPFNAELCVMVGKNLFVSLEIVNTGLAPMIFTAGLHSYLRVGDIKQTKLMGVDGHLCFNKESGKEEIQCGDLTFSGLTTRIYRNTTAASVYDPVLKRSIEVGVKGGNSIVVWNPGPEAAEKFPGFASKEGQNMLCVEAVNPRGCEINLKPGSSHMLSTVIAVSSI